MERRFGINIIWYSMEALFHLQITFDSLEALFHFVGSTRFTRRFRLRLSFTVKSQPNSPNIVHSLHKQISYILTVV